MRTRLAGVALVLGAGALLLLPLSSAGAVGTPSPGATASAVAGFSADATWNGHPVAPADTPAHALSTSFGAPITVAFRWASAGGASGASPGVTDLLLHVVYLGQNLWTKDQGLNGSLSTPSGQYNLTSDLTGSRYLVEGLFVIQLVILAGPHGQLWAESFYVHVLAPNHLTAATIGLGLLCAYEVFALLRVGPHGVPKRPANSTSPPPSPPHDASRGS